MDRVVLNTDVDYQWLTPEMRAQVYILDPQSGFQAPKEETCLNKNLEVQSSHLLNLVAEEIQGELPSATIKNQEEEVNTLLLEIEGQLEEVENMPAKAKQGDVPKEEEEKAQVSFEVFNGESPLTKSDFNDYFVIDMVDEILQKNTYEDPFEIYLIQAKDSIKEYINCLNTSSFLESKGELLEELGGTSFGLNPNHLIIVIGENLMVNV
ncbi:hypothetical protein SLEP1_g47935 [Rubroshorea leprosula]|uniref:Uncharacterized protein n=1 Tax=Rubroshorea leprosula TaxID=152421 RepID=A0AAV5LS38_9ROSI|nr:hypothetical protein SLEP1_g47935 [Rubroshorea leprosula]